MTTPRPAWKPLLLFIGFVALCLVQACLNRRHEFLLVGGISAISLDQLSVHYPHAYTYDNDLDNQPLHVEAYHLGRIAYLFAGRFQYDKYYSLFVSYPPDQYRLMLPFLASFLLPWLSLKNACLVVNVLIWGLASLCVCWLGEHLFGSRRAGLIAGLLYATSYAVIAVSASQKGELMQLTVPVILISLSFYLGHFRPPSAPRQLWDSFALGVTAGVGMFAGGATPYLLAFLPLYGLFTLDLSAYLKRNAVFAAGLLVVYLAITPFIRQIESQTVFELLQHSIAGITPAFLWACFKTRFVGHFIYAIPLPLWLGVAGGLYRIRRAQLVPLVCMFAMYAVSEAIMTAAQGRQCSAMTINYYYLQILLPVYLLTARALDRLLERGAALFLRRAAALLWLAVILFISHLGLLGNYYYTYQGYRPTSPQVLYHSFFTYDNLPR